MGIDITISPLVKTDIPAIIEIENESQPEPWTEKSFIEEFERLHSCVSVARLGGTAGSAARSCSPPGGIAGYVCFWCVADEVQILNIAVHKDCRRRSIGRALLEHAIRVGCERKAGAAILEVRKSNAEARRLYESFGFEIVGERPGYYGVQKEAAVLMELKISREFCRNIPEGNHPA